MATIIPVGYSCWPNLNRSPSSASRPKRLNLRFRCSSSAATVNRSSNDTVDGNSPSRLDCVIVGAGITGLTIAQALATEYSNLLVTEARERVGGNITTVEGDGYLWEEGPNSFQPSDPMLTLVVDSGLEDDLVLGDPNAPRYVFWEGKLRAVPSKPTDLPFFDLMTFPAKIRAAFGALGFRPSPPAREESVEEFVRRNLGDEVFERLIEPFCSGVYAGDPSKLSMKAAFGKVWKLEQNGGSIIGGTIKAIKERTNRPQVPRDPHLPKPKGQTVGSFKKGLAMLPHAISSRLGSKVKLSWKLSSIAKSADEGYTLIYETPEGVISVQSRSVVMTVPSYIASSLLRPLSAVAADVLSKFYYPPVAAVTVSYPQEAIRGDCLIGGELKGFGQLHPRTQGVETLGTIYSSSLFPNRAPPGQVLLLNYIGGATNTEILSRTESQLVEAVDRDLRKMLVKSNAQEPLVLGVRVWPQAIPQFVVGHLDMLNSAKTDLRNCGLEGLFLGGNYVSGVALGRCVEGGYEVAAEIVGMSVFSLLVAAFYCFLGLFLGNKSAEIAFTTVFSSAALSSAILFIRCTSIDPSDRTRYRFRKKKDGKARGRGGDGGGNGNSNHNIKYYGFFMLRQLLARVFRRMERKILTTCIRRKYHLLLDPHPHPSMDSLPPLLPPFPPLVVKDDDHDFASVAPHPNDQDISFCSLCDFEVQKHSKHCRTCNRCVEGFDHHCRWLNTCVGKKNYTTFILLMVFVLIMLIVEGGTAIAIFIRCFADKKGINQELKTRHYAKFPRGVLAAVSVLLVLITAYSSAALGQLFFFHVLLIRKGMRTYDYILAMKEENQFTELESLEEDSDFSSDESTVSNSPEKPPFISRVICRDGGMMNQNPPKLSIRIEGETGSPTLNRTPQGFHASINPWRLITMSQERALLAANKAKERLMMQKTIVKPPLETKTGQPMKSAEKSSMGGMGLTPPLTLKERLPGSPAKFSSPRRRVSCSSTLTPASMESPEHRYRSNFDLQLTDVSRELETYISRQVLCSILRKDGNETSHSP